MTRHQLAAERAGRHYALQCSRAHTPARRAAVGFDRARAAIRDLPADAQTAAWAELTGLLERYASSYSRPVYASRTAPNAPTRACAREAAPSGRVS